MIEKLPGVIADDTDVAAYYDATIAQYLRRWCAGTGCCHFGFWERTTPDHAASLRATVWQLVRAAGLPQAAVRALPRPLEILDAGCGLGGGSRILAECTGGTVTGVTLSWQQLHYARSHYGFQRPEAPSRGRARFVHADYTALPFSAETFDAVVCVESACHADPALVIRDAWRVLKPGGVFALADGIIARPQPEWTEDEAACFLAWSTRWGIAGLQSLWQWHACLRAAGAEDVRLEDWTPNVRPSIRRLARQATWAYPAAWTLHALGRMDDPAWDNVVAARLWARLVASGACGYGTVTARKPG